MHIVGKEERRAKGRQKLADMMRKHDLSVVAIGNGTASRETEQLVAQTIADELKDRDVAYVIVNEAGASVYSTSELGREELPTCDAVQRSAVSIGRRLLDPLSELVKINPANIGVGMYQHDVKANHLRESLDAVVESCVNFVGVDVNSASPALLRYVSGLNQLTARRLYEYRREHGPFRNREQFKDVPGFGSAAFVQAAGFLKINGGDNPLDATWIHPESYQAAKGVLDSLDCGLDEFSSVPDPLPEAPAVQEPAPPEILTAADQPSAEATGNAPPSEVAEPAAAVEPPAAESAPAPAAESELVAEAAPAAETQTATETDTPGETATNAAAEANPIAVAEEATSGETATSETANVAGDANPGPPAAEMPPPTASPAEQNAPPAAAPVEPKSAPKTKVSTKLLERAAQADVDKLAGELHVSKLLLEDLLISLTRVGRDPREDLPAPIFRRGIAKLEDLKPGMELSGTVLNVVDFGAFVDIGLSDSGLVHISRLADRFVRDPHEVVAVGDVLKVWVVEVDKQRRRVSLTAIEPGKERPPQPRPSERGKRPPRRKPAAAAKTSGAGRPSGRGRADGKGVKTPKYRTAQPKRKQRPSKPITKAMEEGKEPLRSFSDLKQFFEKKQPGDDEQSGK